MTFCASRADGVKPSKRVRGPGVAGAPAAIPGSVRLRRDPGLLLSRPLPATELIAQQIPAAYPEVLAIASATAIDGANACKRSSGIIKADTASYFTTDGAGVTVSAPGEDQENVNGGCLITSKGILSLKLGGTTRMSGTSMASPHAAGVAALVVSTLPTATDPSKISCTVKTRIQSAAYFQGAAPLDSPTSSYDFDGAREGIVSAPGAVGSSAGC